jgi:predicted transcriptional regulator
VSVLEFRRLQFTRDHAIPVAPQQLLTVVLSIPYAIRVSHTPKMKLSKIALRGFRPAARGIKQVLGELEADVMDLLWREPNQTVVDVEVRLRRKRDIAHTTVLTTLDRMHRKGYLSREKKGKAFVYSPQYTREEFERLLAQEVLGALLGGLGEPVLSTFIELVGEDNGKLEQLEELIRQKREGLK